MKLHINIIYFTANNTPARPCTTYPLPATQRAISMWEISDGQCKLQGHAAVSYPTEVDETRIRYSIILRHSHTFRIRNKTI